MNSFTHIFFPFADERTVEAIDNVPVRDFSKMPDLSLLPTQEADASNPLNEVTGLRDSQLTRVFDPDLSPLEKQRIMSSLQRMPTAKRNNLSDKDLIALLPSRYNTAMIDDAKYAEYLRGMVDSENVTDAPIGDASTDDVPTGDASE